MPGFRCLWESPLHLVDTLPFCLSRLAELGGGMHVGTICVAALELGVQSSGVLDSECPGRVCKTLFRRGIRYHNCNFYVV